MALKYVSFYFSALLVFSVVACPSAYALWPWESGFKWPWEQQAPQNTSGSPLNWNKRLLDQAKQQEEQKKKQEEAMRKWQEELNKAICNGTSPPPKPTVNPEQKGQSNTWKNFTNSLGQTDSTSGHMRGYDGNQAYMGPGRAGTYVDGGSAYHGSYDGTGILADDGRTTRTMPRNVQWPQ